MKYLAAFLSAVTLTAACAGAELRPLPWSAGLNSASRFDQNSSGRMTIRDDAKEKAVRFDVEFKPGTDFWCYPGIKFGTNEPFSDVEAIRFDIKVESSKGYKSAYLMYNGKPPYVALPELKNQWQTVTIDVAKTAKDPAEINHIRIGFNPRGEKLTFFIRNLEMLSSRRPSTKFDTADAVTAHAPGSAFTQNEPLKFTLKPYAAFPGKWELRNRKNEVIRSGQWPDSGKKELVLEALPNGYYTLSFDSAEAPFEGVRSFAVLPDPASRTKNPDTFFALDSGQSWLARPDSANTRHPQDAYELVSEVVRRAGIEIVRERMSWAECEPAPGKFDWKQYGLNADLLAERGVRVSGMYHNAPAWAKSNTPSLPSDLLAVYNFAKKVSGTFKGKMTNWEFWNEQDIGFAPESAWDYASALKAAYLGFKAGDSALPVAIGGYALTPLGPYSDVVMENGAGAYFDIFNIHSYRPLRDFPEMLRDIRAHLERHDIADRPVWFTENGCRAEGSGRDQSYMAGIKAHSPEQELLIAEFLPKMMIYMQSLGVDRDFFFVLPPYNEGGGNKDWGLMRRDFTVKPGYVVFSTLTDKLGSAEYLGSVELGDGIRGFLYRQPDGSRTLVYWSISEIDTDSERPDLSTADPLERKFTLAAKDGNYSGVDSFGTPFQAKSTGGKLALTSTRFPAILSGLSGIEPTTPFQAIAKRGADGGSFDRSIIFRTELSDAFVLSSTKHSVDVEKDDAPFKLQIFNLSDTPKTGTLSVTGGTVTGVPAEVTIPAFGKVELPLTFTPELNSEFRGELRVEGTFGGKPATALVIPVINVGKLMQSARKVELPGMSDPANYRANASGKMEISYDTPERAVKFHTVFPGNVDLWVYPEYILQLPQESLKNAAGLAFEVKVSAPDKVKQMLVMAVMGREKEHGKAVNLPVIAPTGEWEERIVNFPDSLDPDKIGMLRIGMNPLNTDATYWIRNVRIVYTR